MIIMYDFQTEDYEYEIDGESFRKALINIFAKNYEIEIEKAQKIIDDDWADFERAVDFFYDELYSYFESRAYKEYLDRRYA